VQAELLKVQQRELADLLECRVRCDHCSFLMGIPDPTASLFVDEVYIPGWRHTGGDSGGGGGDSDGGSGGGSGSGSVVVSRFPLHDERALVKLQLVTEEWAGRALRRSGICSHKNTEEEEEEEAEEEEEDSESFRKNKTFEALQRYFSFSDGLGVVVFGTKARPGAASCTPVKPMGGDYDGDMYFVCGYRPIVDGFCVQATDSRGEEEEEEERSDDRMAATATVDGMTESLSGLCLHGCSSAGDTLTSVKQAREGEGEGSEVPCFSFSAHYGQDGSEQISCCDEDDEDEPPLIEAAIHSAGIELNTPVYRSLVTPLSVRGGGGGSRPPESPESCLFLKYMLTPPVELSRSPSQLVEALIWEWMAEDVYTLGRHTSEGERGDVSLSVCDHNTSFSIKHRMKYFENNSKLISK
jgi:hypothetical protein